MQDAAASVVLVDGDVDQAQRSGRVPGIGYAAQANTDIEPDVIGADLAPDDQATLTTFGVGLSLDDDLVQPPHQRGDLGHDLVSANHPVTPRVTRPVTPRWRLRMFPVALLINLIVILIIAGLIMWLVRTLPIDQWIKTAIMVLVIIVLLLYLLSLLPGVTLLR